MGAEVVVVGDVMRGRRDLGCGRIYVCWIFCSSCNTKLSPIVKTSGVVSAPSRAGASFASIKIDEGANVIIIDTVSDKVHRGANGCKLFQKFT